MGGQLTIEQLDDKGHIPLCLACNAPDAVHKLRGKDIKNLLTGWEELDYTIYRWVQYENRLQVGDFVQKVSGRYWRIVSADKPSAGKLALKYGCYRYPGWEEHIDHKDETARIFYHNFIN